MKKPEIEDIYPLSPMQEGLLYQALYDSSTQAYFIQMTFRLLGVFRKGVFEESWNILCQRHSVLRSSFMHEDLANPVQVVFKERKPEVSIIDLSDLGEKEQLEHIEEYKKRDMKRGFNLQSDVLMRITVFQLGESLCCFVWSYHHILIDGWCMGILQGEFIKVYKALINKEKPDLPVLAPYRNYVQWLKKQDRQVAREYWQRYLAGYEQQATVPKNVHGKNSYGYILKEMTFFIEEDIAVKLKDLAAKQNVTLNTVVRTIWGLLLSRYNRTEDVVFGTIVSGRPPELDGVENMVGLFINANPVRTSIKANQSFLDVIKAGQKAYLESGPYHFLPLAEIQNQSFPGQELIDHLLIFQNYTAGDEIQTEGGLTEYEFKIDFIDAHDQTHYDFNLIVIPGERIGFKINYNNNVYTEHRIEQISEHLRTAIRSVLQSPDKVISELQIIPDGEQKKVLHQFNDTVTLCNIEDTLLDLFDAQVEKTPDVVSLVYGDVSLTYLELNEQANRIACYLLESHNIQPDDRVGLLMDRSEWVILGVLGIFKSGGAYVPIDPNYPLERIRYMLEDSGCKVLLTESKYINNISESESRNMGLKVVDIRNIQGDGASDSGHKVTPNQLAYVIYTSGSTGKPKGCQVEHRNLFHYLNWANKYYYPENEGGNFGLYSTLSFDFTVTSMFLPLIRGKTLHVFPQEIDLTDIFDEYFSNNSVMDSIKITPSHISLLKQMDISSTNINLAIIGGEALHIDQVRFLQNLNPDMKIYNEYGPTETTVGCIVKHVKPEDNMVLIGKPIDNTRIYILDQYLMPSPIEITGEIYIGGYGVTRGYLNKDELTRERFLESHFCNGERIYKTGDLGRWLPDGNIECLGRIDDQVKIRGHRVELGEIEAVIAGHPAVNEVAVVIKETGQHDMNLVAYIVNNKQNQNIPSSGELRNYLKEKLPENMVPVYFVELEKLPFTPNGKLDKNKLSSPGEADIGRTGYKAPQDELEKQLASILEEILQIKKIGTQDNFLELGGHSLKAMQVVSRIHKERSIKISLKDFFRLPTITGLADMIRKTDTTKYYGIGPAEQQDYYESSYAQKRLWILHRMGKATAIAYNMPKAFIVEDALDTVALKKVFSVLIERHEVLRTAFVEIEGEPMQKVLSKLEFAIKEVDLSSAEGAEEQAKEISEQDAITAFDLANPPLFRVTVIKLNEDRYMFVLTIHHIIGDGWSMNIMYKEILSLYDAFRRGIDKSLRPLRIQYKDYAVWQNAKNFELEGKYWLAKMADAPEQLRLPYDFPFKKERDFRGSTEDIILDKDIVQGLKAIAIQKKTTLSNVILTIFKLLLFQLSKQEDLCIGISVANRNHPDMENLIGFFVNILPIRSIVSENMEFGDLLDQVIRNTHEAFEHQDYPFDLLIQKLNPHRVSNRQSIVNVIYGFQNFADIHIDIEADNKDQLSTDEIDNTDNVKDSELSFKTSKFDLTLFVLDMEESLKLYMEYDTGLFLPETIRRNLSILHRFAKMVSNEMIKKRGKNETKRL